MQDLKQNECDNFMESVITALNERFQGEVTVKMHDTRKNNGTLKKGILVSVVGSRAAIIVYPEDFYSRYQNGTGMGQIINEIMSMCLKGETEKSAFDYLNNYDIIKNKIYFMLINTVKNQDILQESPHKNVLDYSIVYYLQLRDEGYVMFIRKSHMSMWGITEETLGAVAMENTKTAYPAQLRDIRDMMKTISLDRPKTNQDLLKQGEIGDAPLYILTNSQNALGAACIAYPEMLERIGDLLNEDFYVIPSSIHETLICRKSLVPEGTEWGQIIQEVNFNAVQEEEVLGDKAHLYMRKKKILK